MEGRGDGLKRLNLGRSIDRCDPDPQEAGNSASMGDWFFLNPENSAPRGASERQPWLVEVAGLQHRR